MFLTWLKDIIGNAVSAVSLVDELGDSVASFFCWLPAEWFYLISVGFVIVLAVGLFRLFKG